MSQSETAHKKINSKTDININILLNIDTERRVRDQLRLLSSHRRRLRRPGILVVWRHLGRLHFLPEENADFLRDLPEIRAEVSPTLFQRRRRRTWTSAAAAAAAAADARDCRRRGNE